MGMLAKFTKQQMEDKLQKQIKEVEHKDVKGFIARMAKHYELKKLKQQLSDIQGKK